MMALSTLSPVPSGSSRWRSILITKKRSSRGGDKKQISQLPTVIAAATEKIVMRQGRSPQYVQSEGLTATQFAFLAGIRIKDSNEEEPDDFCNEQKNTSILIPMARSISNHSHYQKNQVPQIWDSAFWQQHDDDDGGDSADKTSLEGALAVAASPSPSLSTSPSYASTMSSSCSEQSVNATCTSSLVRSSGPSVIHKGRFKIVLGQDDSDTKPVEPQCVEWRRKRACTN